MKKIINAVIAAACVLSATSCSMAIASTNKAKMGESFKDDLTANVANGNTSRESFKVYNIEGASSFDKDSEDKTYITVTFTTDVDKASANGITINSIINDIDADAGLYKTDKTLEFTSVVYENTIQLGVNLKDVNVIEVFVDASKVTAKNGQKLDMDEDKTGGEVEDSYSTYFTSATSDFTLVDTYKRKFQRDNKLSSSITGSNFGKSNSKGLYDRFYITHNLNEDLSELLTSAITIQTFNASTKTWSDVATKECLYTPTRYTFIFEELPENTFCRVVCKDLSKLKTIKKYNGYERVYTTNSKEIFEVIKGVSYNSKGVVDQSFFSSVTMNTSNTSINSSTYKSMNSITFTVKSNNSSYSNDYNYGSLPTRYSHSVTGIQDMDVIKHVKLYDANLNPISISEDNCRIVYTGDYTYGYYGDKTGYSTVTYYFKNPVRLPKYNNSNYVYVYADEDLTINFHTYSSSEPKGTMSYKMGKSTIFAEYMLTQTDGRKKITGINY